MVLDNILSIVSPNRDDRPSDALIDMLVLHYTDMESGEEAIARLCDRQAKVSAHYVVEEDGRLFALVPEEDRAWHAGVSRWRGRDSVNSYSVGIEIVNPGHSCGYRPFPEAQMHTLIRLCKDIVIRHSIPVRNVVAHSDIAPTRKTDPGELFDWARLAGEGIGLWPEQLAAGSGQLSDNETLEQGDNGDAIRTLQQHLSEYGYDIPDDGQFGEQTKAVTIAFQRHFRQDNISGIWDAECQARLNSLLQQTTEK